MSDHARMERSGLLYRRLDEAAIASWPRWARAHMAACEECQLLRLADTILRATASRARVRAKEEEHVAEGEQFLDLPQLGLPDIEAVRARAERLGPPPPLAALFGFDGASDEARPAYRDAEHHPLEVSLGEGRVRAWDPDARHLAVFVYGGGRPAALVASGTNATPGVAAQAETEVPPGASVVAIASSYALDEPLLLVWIRDVARQPVGTPPPLGELPPSIHARVVRAPERVRPALVRVTDVPLAEASPSVREQLLAAAAEGAQGRVTQAAARYEAALAEAVRQDDAAGVIRARAGLALAFVELGWSDDANALLALLAHEELDALHAARLSRIAVRQALCDGDFERAEAWLTEAVAHASPDDPWVAPLAATLAFARGAWARLVDVGESSGPQTLRPDPRAVMDYRTSIAYAELGHADRALELAEAVPDVPDAPTERLLWRALAWLRIARLRGSDPRAGIDPAISPLQRAYLDRQTGGVGRWEAIVLAHVVEELLAINAPAPAATLLRAAFLGPSDEPLSALVAVSTPASVFCTDPQHPERVRRLGLRPGELRALVTRAREQAVDEEGPREALHALRALLLPDPLAASRVVVASDDCLAGVPWLAVVGGDRPRSAFLPAVSERLRLSGGRPPAHGGIASLADSYGDLPWAAREVDDRLADIVLRGSEVTRAALAHLPPVRLLHIATHVSRTGGTPALLFADGALRPAEIASMTLAGHPVVLISGCASAVRGSERGTERSLVDAFVRAGARAVVATRWPVRDQEMHGLIRALLAMPSFEGFAYPVAQVASTLRAGGAPARVWAALAVYEA